MSALSMKFGFIGAGKMATALARGWVARGLLEPAQILASAPGETSRRKFAEAVAAPVTHSNTEVVESAEVLVLGIKPQVMPHVLDEIRSRVTARHLVLSVAAGVSLRQLQEGLGADCRCVRVMPNTPCLVGESASGYCPADTASPEDVALVDRLLNAVGKAVRVPESLLDAVTGLSGSGPAYIAVIIEALADGGVLMGLPRDVALLLAAQTVFGAAKMIAGGECHPGVLKDMVSSPGGTTIAGLHALERGNLRGTLIQCVEAATKRAKELGQQEKK
jgi:pyrroline-5-carboxylate reductase